MQFVNFYLDQYQPKPLSFDSRFAGLTLCLIVAGCIVNGLIGSSRVNELKLVDAQKKSHLLTTQQQVIALQKKLAGKKKVKNLDALLIRNQQELNSYRKIVTRLSSKNQVNHFDYSLILKQLSELPAQSVWLTEIEMNQQNLNLHGRSTNPESIPLYVDHLKAARSLKRHFDELKIDRDSTDNRIVNFSLINGKAANEQ